MTLHTRVAISGDITPESAFTFARSLIGADQPGIQIHDDGLSVRMGQGLPALLWVTRGDDGETCDHYCDDDCDGSWHDPACDAMVHFDTAYGYTGAYRWGQTAGCGDLHAHLVREVGRWVEKHGGTWRWYDESGDGWNVTHADLGNLGMPRLGAVGLPEVQS